jgi:uncharacterized protein YcaQ
MPADLSLAEARRIALAAQGFDRPRPARVTTDHLRRVIRRLGLLQVDYVNVLAPAQYQVPFSRLGPYDRSRLDALVYRRREFTEQWAHEASIIPVETWPLLRHRMAAHRPRPWGIERVFEAHPEYCQWVLAEIRARGPLTAGDLPVPPGAPRRIPGAWHGSVPRAILENHFGRGVLAIANRLPNFARAYDLAASIIPPNHYARQVSPREADRELVRLAARAHGIATASDLADYYRMPAAATRAAIADLVSSGELRPVQVETWRETAYLHAQARLPQRIHAAALLSPFDPIVWTRQRAARLFAFDYRIEIWVPRERRKWGYYVLPFLLGDKLVARVDLKANRAAGTLEVPAAYLEPGAPPKTAAAALNRELQSMAHWLGLRAARVAF